MKAILLIALWLYPYAYAQAQSNNSTTVEHPDLRREILHMVEVDQAVRSYVSHLGSGTPLDSATVALWTTIDTLNTARIKEIIRDYGWPGKSLVGEDGAHGAWLLVQHADRDLPFQQQVLNLLRAAVEAGEASGKDLAYLVDRVRVAEGKPQVYGTQLHHIDGELMPQPIEDEPNVDTRRAEVGLTPLEKYLELVKGRIK